MDPILVASIAVWLAATGYSILLPGKVSDWRLGFLAAMLALIALGQGAALLSPRGPLAGLVTPPGTGPYSLLVGLVAVLAVYSLNRMFLDQRRAQDDQRNSEIMYGTLAEIFPVGLFYNDQSGRCVFVNRCWCSITGQTVEEAMGTGWARRIHPDDVQEAAETFRVGQREGHPLMRGEFRLERPDGRTIWALWQAAVARKSDGEIAGYVGTITDITDLKKAEESVRVSEANYRTIFDAAEDAIFILDSDSGAILDANQAVFDLFGYTSEETHKLNIAALRSDDGTATQEEAVPGDNKAGVGKPQRIEWKARHKSGRQFWCEAGTKPAEIGGERRIIVVVRDISDRKLAEERLREANDQLQARVEERTSHLAAANRALEAENAERVKLEQALNESVQLLQAILENTPAVVWVRGLDGRFQLVNRRYEELFDVRRTEVYGRDLHEVFTREVADRIRQDDLKVLESDAAEEFEETVQQEDGPHHYIDSRFPVRDAEGTIYAVCGMMTDVTGRRRVEQALRESEGRLQAILDNAPAVIHVKDLEGRYQLVNRRFEALCRVTREEACGKTAHDILTPEAAEAFRANELKVIETNAAQQFEETIVQDDGPHQYLSIRFPLRDSSGAPVGSSCIATDVTDLVRAQRERDRIFNLVPVLLGTTNSDGYMTVSNPACEHVLGWQRDELARMHFSEIVHPADRDAALAAFDRLRGGVPLAGWENRWRCKDGSYKWLSWTVIPAPDEELIYAAALDITSSKLAQETMRRHRDDIADLLRVHTMGELASQIAHELNQPLSAIASYANGVVMRLEAGRTPMAQIIDVVRRIAQQALEAGGLINRIREFARKERGLRLETVNLNNLVKAAAGILKSGVERGVEFRLELDSSLPEIEVDTAQLEQVLVNLMRNGIEAMEGGGEGSGSLLVRTSRSDPDHVEFSVRDAGVGLPLGRLDDVFEPFFTTKPLGLGMGLAISRTIMEAHRGRLWASRNPGGGATFRGVIPVRQEASPES